MLTIVKNNLVKLLLVPMSYLIMLSNSVTATTVTHAQMPTGGNILTKTLSPCLYDAPACCNGEIRKTAFKVTFDMGDDYEYGSNPFSSSLELDVFGYWECSGGAPTAISAGVPLAINESRPEVTYYFEMTDLNGDPERYDRLEFKIKNYVAPTSDFQNGIRLRLEFIYDYGYKPYFQGGPCDGTGNFITLNNPTAVSGSDLRTKFSWNSLCGWGEEYQFQLLRLYNSNPSKLSETDISASINWSQALDIHTNSPDQQLILTMAEGQGFYVWRVRPIGDFYDGGASDPRNYGEWSDMGGFIDGVTMNVNTGSVVGKNHIFWHNEILGDNNWIYTREFGEGDWEYGKNVRIKESINYANGLNMPQQSQVRSSVNDQVIVGQTMYDFSARGAMQVIPVPVDNKSYFGYQTNMTLNSLGNLYTANDFDGNINYKNPSPMRQNSGDHLDYYSQNNNDKQISSAEGYPFTRTQFKEDATGRVREESSYGNVNRLTSKSENSHTVKTYYTATTEEELIRVFGDEAPKAETVTRVLKEDQNKVLNVSYIDEYGQTIATCLFMNGKNKYPLDPLDKGNMEGLPSQANAEILTNYPGNQRILDGQYGSKSTTSFVWPNEFSTTATVSYEINKSTVEDLCENYCKACDYYLEITGIWVEGNDVILDKSWHLDPDNDDLCNNTFWNYTEVVDIDSLGTYVFTKRIRGYNRNTGTSLFFIDEHQIDLSAKYKTELDAALIPLENALATHDLTTVYSLIGASNETTYPHGSTKDYAVYKDGVTGCEEVITIDINRCETNVCPSDKSVDLVQVFLDAWANESTYIGTNGSSRYDFLDNLYTRNEFKDMINNLILDFPGQDNCDKIWGCWNTVVHSYKSLKDLEAQSLAESWDPHYEVDFLGEFFRCIGKDDVNGTNRNFIGFTNTTWGTDGGVLSTCVSSCTGTEGYLSHPYAYFNYTAGTSTDCENLLALQSSKTFPSGPPYAANYYTTKELEDFHNCLKFLKPGYTGNVQLDPTKFSKQAKMQCENECEKRRLSFKNQIIKMFHSENLIVEKDQYHLRFDSHRNTYLPDYGNPLSNNFKQNMEWDVCWSEVVCLTDMLVDHCKEGCDYTPASNGAVSTQDFDDFKKSLTYSFELTFNASAPGSCPTAAGEAVDPYDPDWTYLSVPTNCSTNVKAPIDDLISVLTTTFVNQSTSSTTGTILTPSMLPPNLTILINGICIPWPNNYGFRITGDLIEVVLLNASGFPTSTVLCSATFTGMSAGLGTISFDPNTNLITYSGPDQYTATLSCPEFCDVCLPIPDPTEVNANWTAGGLVPFSMLGYKFEVNISDVCFPATGYGLDIYTIGGVTTVDFVTIVAGKVGVVLASSTGLYDITAGGSIEIDPTTGQLLSRRVGSPDLPINCVKFCCELPGGITGTLNGGVGTQPNGGPNNLYCDKYNGLCFRWVPIPVIDENDVHVFEPLSCEEIFSLDLSNEISYFRYDFVQDKLQNLKDQYITNCTDPFSVDDKFNVALSQGLHHYTLYYYDRAGNLIKTVPPEGVDKLDVTLSNVMNRNVSPDHNLTTEYRYDSKKQMVWQKTPNANYDATAQNYASETDFYYDMVGRMRFSQNEQQKLNNTYSYVKYDDLSRVIETGESSQYASNQDFVDYVENASIPSGSRKEFVQTVYDNKLNTTVVTTSYLGDGVTFQRNLQNRISYTFASSDYSIDLYCWTFYSYDVHGNVEWMGVHVPQRSITRTKYIGYEYDLVTANVKKVKYQEGKLDQLFHRYTYDADNRIVLSETSTDNINWDRDAGYEYYVHGPLKRTEIGEDKLQGVDYTYTIEGWMKGINHPKLDINIDPGQDGVGASSFAPDAFGMLLNYHDKDFVHNPTLNSPFASLFADNITPDPKKNLYNSNIGSWLTQTYHGATTYTYPGMTGQYFKYDQLNRIKKSIFYEFDNPVWNLTPNSEYNTWHEYDGNGNITSLVRNAINTGTPTQPEIDDLEYTYAKSGNRLVSNRLNSVEDITISGLDGTMNDIEGLSNYAYDEIGNLISDSKEEIAAITWWASGKIRGIYRTATSAKPDLEFYYDGMGNRVGKYVIAKDASSGTPVIDQRNWEYYSYIRDAQGNVMATYKSKLTPQDYQLPQTEPDVYHVEIWLIEQPIYGSSRLGMRTKETLLAYYPVIGCSYDNTTGVITHPVFMPNVTEYNLNFPYNVFPRDLGDKTYELTDHLGNVRATLSDVKESTVTGGTPTFFTANVSSASNYYPFGMVMPARNSTSTEYRYGFNGMEKDDEVKGVSGSSYDYGARIYDSRVGRFLSIDRLSNNFPFQSPYLNAGNTPIMAVDINGDYIYIVTKNGVVAASRDMLIKTTSGKEIWDKYATGELAATHDIYITSYNDKNGDNVGVTINDLGNVADGAAISDGTFKYLPEEYAQLEGTIVKDKNSTISIVSLNSAFIGDITAEGANTLFHEIQAHIDDQVGSESEDHENFGVKKVLNEEGNFSHFIIKEGSTAHNMLKELKKVAEEMKSVMDISVLDDQLENVVSEEEFTQ